MARRAVARTPMRTCIGCRLRTAKHHLLRVVVCEDESEDGTRPRVVLDPDGRLPGRGAHLHPDLGCLDLAVRRRAFGRALRRSGLLDTTDLRTELLARVGAADDDRGGPSAPVVATDEGDQT